MTLAWSPKDPDETEDFTINWANALTGADTIQSSSWTVESGITKGAETNTSTTTTVWISGGAMGQTYDITNTVITAGGRTMEQTVRLPIRKN